MKRILHEMASCRDEMVSCRDEMLFLSHSKIYEGGIIRCDEAVFFILSIGGKIKISSEGMIGCFRSLKDYDLMNNKVSGFSATAYRLV